MAASYTVRAAAAVDVMDASRYYEGQRPGLGSQFVDRFEECVRHICNAPSIRRLLRGGYLRCLMKQFPYAVYYRFDGTEVTVYLVIHAARSPAVRNRRLP